MDEFLYYSELYDLYNGLLTDKQKESFEDYYFENLTIEEIAINRGVSKNAISKMIIQTKEELERCENKLHFKEYTDKLKNEFKDEKDILLRIEKYDNIIV